MSQEQNSTASAQQQVYGLTGTAARQDRRDRIVGGQLQAAHEHAHVVDALQREQRRPLSPDPAAGGRLACGTREESEGTVRP